MSEVNSVKIITEECEELINIANELHYVDIGVMVRGLKDKLKELNDLFDSHPERVKDVAKLKSAVEIKALQLEYYVQCRSDERKDKYTLRAFTTIFLQDVQEICQYKARLVQKSGTVVQRSDSRNVDALRWVDYFRFARRLNLRSNHIHFELDNEDESMIKIITEAINDFKVEHPDMFGERGTKVV